MGKNKDAPSLADIQRMLQDAVVSRDRQAPAIGDWIEVISPGPTPAERIAVYGDGWFLRLEESLRDDYPEVVARLGDARWEELLHDYLRTNPSSEPSIARASDRLPEYLVLWDASLKDTEIEELAVLERAIYNVFGTQDAQIWKVDELATMSDDEAEVLRFELQPSVSLFAFNWNAVDLSNEDVEPKKIAQKAVVYREGFSAKAVTVSDQEYTFLLRIKSCPLLTDLIGEFEGSNWMQWLARFAANGILCKQKSE